MKTEKVEFYKDRSGKHRWKVTGKNGERIAASSEGFERLAGAKKNLQLLRTIVNGHILAPDTVPLWRPMPGFKKGDILRFKDKRGKETEYVVGKVGESTRTSPGAVVTVYLRGG